MLLSPTLFHTISVIKPRSSRHLKQRFTMDPASIEAIKNQERLIEKEIADKIPFVSDKVSIQELKNDYQMDDFIYQNKINNLEKDYGYLRRTRPDGNCFFRAFGFAYFESLLNDLDKEQLNKFIKFTRTSKDELIKLGLPSVTIEDFFDVFLEVLLNIQDGVIKTSKDLLEKFCDQATSDYIVVYFRLITSGYLQQNAETFTNFIVGASSILDFCKTEVEPMYKESDHIHVVAITSALKVCTRIVYMDRGGSSTSEVGDLSVNAHDFYPEEDQRQQDPPMKPRIHLLYRPGHYDVLYAR